MTYRTLMVHLKVGHANEDLLRVTSDLADRYDAKVIGIVACQPTPMVYSDGYSPGAIVEIDRTEIDREIKVAEAEFRAAFQGKKTATEWRSATIFESVADYVSRECASADLIITSGLSLDPHDTARPEKPGDIVMQAGRPVLVVPQTANTLKFDRVVIAWKNTQESRRAVTDALPLLNRATSVTVLVTMHAYRDAIPGTLAALALYPGKVMRWWPDTQNYGGLGALPLTPGHGRDALETFLKNLSRATKANG